jgi:hypothetical protein
MRLLFYEKKKMLLKPGRGENIFIDIFLASFQGMETRHEKS